MNNPYLPQQGIFSSARQLLKSLRKSISYRTIFRKLHKHDLIDRHKGMTIVEAGCGAGYLLESLESAFPASLIVAGDYSEELIRYSQNKVQRALLIQFDATALPLKNDVADLLFSLQVIEHLSAPNYFLQECARVLRPGGILVISTPNPASVCAKILKESWQGFKTDHISLRSPHAWRAAITRAGFAIVEDGTTGLTGFPVLRIFPLSLLNYIPMAVWGFFPWYSGESYVVIARKELLIRK